MNATSFKKSSLISSNDINLFLLDHPQLYTYNWYLILPQFISVSSLLNYLTPRFSYGRNYIGLIFDSPQHSVLNVLVKCFAKNDHCHHNVSNLTSTYFEPSIFHASFLFLTITLQDIFHHPHYSSEETKTQPANNGRSKN